MRERRGRTRTTPKTGGKGSTKPRFDATKRAAFIKAILCGQGRIAASRAIGVDPVTPRRHLRADPDFARRVSEAEMQAEGEKVEGVEDALYQAALSGNVVAIQVFLYNRAPDRWQDKRSLNLHTPPEEAARRLAAVLGLSGPEDLPT